MYMCIYVQKSNKCMHRLHVFVCKSTNSNIDRPWIVLPSSIHPSANSKLVPRPLTPCQLVFMTMVLSIDYLSLHDRQSVIERTLNSSWRPTVPATKWRRLCIFATKRRRLRVTHPGATCVVRRSGGARVHSKLLQWGEEFHASCLALLKFLNIGDKTIHVISLHKLTATLFHNSNVLKYAT